MRHTPRCASTGLNVEARPDKKTTATTQQSTEPLSESSPSWENVAVFAHKAIHTRASGCRKALLGVSGSAAIEGALRQRTSSMDFGRLGKLDCVETMAPIGADTRQVRPDRLGLATGAQESRRISAGVRRTSRIGRLTLIVAMGVSIHGYENSPQAIQGAVTVSRMNRSAIAPRLHDLYALSRGGVFARPLFHNRIDLSSSAPVVKPGR
jgi:hypothetical protein